MTKSMSSKKGLIKFMFLFACLGNIMLDSKFLSEQNYQISRRINVLAIWPCKLHVIEAHFVT